MSITGHAALRRAARTVALVVAVGASGPGSAQQTAAPPLASLSWIAGHWVGEVGGGRSEEVWTVPAGDSMLGMWRLVTDGQARVLELLAITQEAEGPVLRLRHFSRTLVAREDKDQAPALPLTSWGPQRAVFDGRDPNGPVRLTYTSPAPDRLQVVLERGGKTETFSFARRATLGF